MILIDAKFMTRCSLSLRYELRHAWLKAKCCFCDLDAYHRDRMNMFSEHEILDQ